MSTLHHDGYLLAPNILPASEIAALRQEAARLVDEQGQPAHGVRNLLSLSKQIRKMAEDERLHKLLSPHVEAPFGCVRGILFDKSPATNWKVTWHQDLTIAVKEKVALPGYGPWSVKAQVPHVQPPEELLDGMVTLRLHLDETTASNGALQVIPGSHRNGKLDSDAIHHWRQQQEPFTCEAAPGDALLMKPLLLHASSKATAASHRRVIHLEYAPLNQLAKPLAWTRL